MNKFVRSLAILLLFTVSFSSSALATGKQLSIEDLLNEFKNIDSSKTITVTKNDITLEEEDSTVDGILNIIKNDVSNTANYTLAASVFSKNNLNGIKVFVEGSIIDFGKYNNVEPLFMLDKKNTNRTMVPARAIVENLGGLVTWDASTKTITMQLGEKVIKLIIDSPIAYVNGNPTTLDIPAKILEGGRTVIPLRFVSENLGQKVGWHPGSNGLNVISIPE